jgi:anti-sigma B factor antagonist
MHTFNTETHGPWVVVHPVGEIDLAVADKFRATVLDALGQAGRVAIDFSEVTFLDSSGLSVIAAALRQTQNDGSQLILVDLPERVRLVLDITGMTEILDIRDALAGEEQSATRPRRRQRDGDDREHGQHHQGAVGAQPQAGDRR